MMLEDRLIPTFPPPDKRQRPPFPRVPASPRVAERTLVVDPSIAALVAQVDSTRISDSIGHLASFPTRHTLSPQNVAAAQWLRGEFQSFGYTDVVLHDFTLGAVSRHNVICTKVGSVDATKHLIICAHYDSRMSSLSDSTSVAPGADDNGSGVAALLEIARVLAPIDTAWSVRFAAFSGEEQGLVGSTAYAAFANSSGMQIPLLINLDMIGHPENPADPTIVVEQDLGNDVATNDAPSQAFAAQMVQAAADYTTIKTVLGPIYSSDYMPFEHFGYVCIGAFDGADAAPFYHTSNDTPDKVRVSFCAEVIRMILATVLTVAGKPDP